MCVFQEYLCNKVCAKAENLTFFMKWNIILRLHECEDNAKIYSTESESFYTIRLQKWWGLVFGIQAHKEYSCQQLQL